jgi:hypothetical protein
MDDCIGTYPCDWGAILESFAARRLNELATVTASAQFEVKGFWWMLERALIRPKSTERVFRIGIATLAAPHDGLSGGEVWQYIVESVCISLAMMCIMPQARCQVFVWSSGTNGSWCCSSENKDCNFRFLIVSLWMPLTPVMQEHSHAFWPYSDVFCFSHHFGLVIG